MSSIEQAKLFVLTPNEAHHRFCLRRRADVIFFACDSEKRTGDRCKIHAPPTQVHLALDQLVL
ncbi:MAG TPA: hypothetical protein VFN35_33265, partial [Ktedonobacteraceae bacterium]|nr:hypothetical protein [Ktedonobacteraceae bacterium]